MKRIEEIIINNYNSKDNGNFLSVNHVSEAAREYLSNALDQLYLECEHGEMKNTENG